MMNVSFIACSTAYLTHPLPLSSCQETEQGDRRQKMLRPMSGLHGHKSKRSASECVSTKHRALFQKVRAPLLPFRCCLCVFVVL